MDVYIYKLRFSSAVHFGDTGIDLENVQEFVNSDTFFSALINAVNIYYGLEDATKIITDFLTTPPFVLSSLFVYHRDFHFLPKPLDDSFFSEEIRRTKGKDLKKLKWIEKSDFLKLLTQNNLEMKDIDEMLKKQREYKKAFIKEIRPRVTVDRITNQGSIYHCAYLHFKKEAGLYGLVSFNDPNMVDKFKKILCLLGETGLGGEKTYGCGMFDVTFEKVEGDFLKILSSKNRNTYVLLSLYHPAETEKDVLKDILVAYDITRKKGWIGSGRKTLPLKRKSVGFIVEGSVLKKLPKGCIVDITPENLPEGILEHRVYRYGYAFTAPLKEV